jgi:hypothetical protein
MKKKKDAFRQSLQNSDDVDVDVDESNLNRLPK